MLGAVKVRTCITGGLGQLKIRHRLAYRLSDTVFETHRSNFH